jgi:hypothetical protein
MPSYRVYLYTDIQWTMRRFKASSPQEALNLARKHAAEHFFELDFENYEGSDFRVNDIEVCDEQDNKLAIWCDDHLRLQIAAYDLLEAAEKVVAQWAHGDLAEAVRELNAAIAKAKGGAG